MWKTKATSKWTFSLGKCQFRSCTGLRHRTIIISNLYKAFIKWSVFSLQTFCRQGFFLFSVVSDIQISITTLSYEPTVISKWTLQWEKIHSGLTKQSQQMILNRKNKKLLHPTTFNTFREKTLCLEKFLFNIRHD